MCRRQFTSTDKTQQAIECPALKKISLGEKYEKLPWNLFQKTTSRQRSGSVLAKSIEQVKKNKIENEPKKLKIVS